MLDKALAQAKENRAQQHQRIGLVLMVGIVAALIVYGLYIWLQNQTNNNESATGAASQASTIPQVDAPELILHNANELRQQFKELAQQYQDELLPELTLIAQGSWQPQRLTVLEDKYQQALGIFTQGEYGQAVTIAKQLLTESQATIDDWHQAFAEAMKTAQHAFDKRQAQPAEIALKEALTIKPEHPEALALELRLSVLNQVEALLSDYQVAQVENDLVRQQALLEQILNLDPERTSLQQALAQVTELLRQQSLSAHIEAGLNAVANGQLMEAKQKLAAARRVAKQASEYALLAEQVNSLSVQIKQQSAHKKIETFIAKDKWLRAVTLAKAFIAEFSGTAEAKHSLVVEVKAWLVIGEQVVQASRQVNQLLSRPERLQDSGVRDYAKGLIEQYAMLAVNSLAFADNLLSLEQLIQQLETDVDITIESDGETYIVLIGHGNIGTTTKRQLTLKPGQYVFEGRRQGYRSVRVKLDVAANSANLGIKVVCHERI